MQDQIKTAFAALDARLIEADQEFAKVKRATLKEAISKAEAGFKAGEYPYRDMTSGYGRFDVTMAKISHYGSKGMMNLLDGRSEQDALAQMKKNTEALIAKREAQIIKALTKKGITEIPDFELVQTSDGYEGEFKVAGHKVTITTILAGGYNIQRLHNRTLVKVK